MSNTTRFVLLLLGIVVGLVVISKVVTWLVIKTLAMVIPLLLVGGVVAALYFAFGRKALGGGRRTLPRL